jgi:putative SOS response-associated peptidase YedK
MCVRFALFRWTPGFAAQPGFPVGQKPRWNIAPGAQILLQRDLSGEPTLGSARWGLTPAWLKDLSRTPAQARAETLAQQPMFREALRLRRGLIPANGFYEWRGAARKRPYWISAEQPLLYFAALWEAYPVPGQVYYSAAVVTQAAASLRRPLILNAQQQQLWLNPDAPLDSVQALLGGSPAFLRERLLGHWVNDPHLDGPECLTPA